jgi:hypothetical protein
MKALVKSARGKLSGAIEALVEAEEDRVHEKERKEREKGRNRRPSKYSSLKTDPTTRKPLPSRFGTRDTTMENDLSFWPDSEDKQRRSRRRSHDSDGLRDLEIARQWGRFALLSPKGTRIVKSRDSRDHEEDLHEPKARPPNKEHCPRREDRERDENSSQHRRMSSTSNRRRLSRSKDKGLRHIPRDDEIPDMPVASAKWEDEDLSGFPPSVSEKLEIIPLSPSPRDMPLQQARSEEVNGDRWKHKEEKCDTRRKKRKSEGEGKQRWEAVFAEVTAKREHDRKMNLERNRGEALGRKYKLDKEKRYTPPTTPRRKTHEDKVVLFPGHNNRADSVIEPPAVQPKVRNPLPRLVRKPSHIASPMHAGDDEDLGNLHGGIGDMTRTFVYGMVTKEEKEANDRMRAELKVKEEETCLAIGGKPEKGERKLRLGQQTEAPLNYNAGIGDNTRTYVYGMVTKEEKKVNDKARRERDRGRRGG